MYPKLLSNEDYLWGNLLYITFCIRQLTIHLRNAMINNNPSNNSSGEGKKDQKKKENPLQTVSFDFLIDFLAAQEFFIVCLKKLLKYVGTYINKSL